VRSHNPVLTRLTPETQVGRRDADVARYPGGAGYSTEAGYQSSVVAPAEAERMTVDDVVVRTVGLLALTGLSGAAAWIIVPDRVAPAFWIGAAMVGLIIGLVIAFKQITNPLLIGAYAVVEGVFVGLVSKAYEAAFDGIVLQAVIGSFGVFFLMAILYKSRVIRATPTFIKWVTGALIGVVAIIVINFVISLFGVNTHLRDGSPLAIGFSLLVIGVAALTFILDFHQVEEGVRQGLPERYAWLSAFGILVGLIWLYLEILRLLSYLRGND
jgi:uncharacterized YccA/Bax inhibitor family protein